MLRSLLRFKEHTSPPWSSSCSFSPAWVQLRLAFQQTHAPSHPYARACTQQTWESFHFFVWDRPRGLLPVLDLTRTLTSVPPSLMCPSPVLRVFSFPFCTPDCCTTPSHAAHERDCTSYFLVKTTRRLLERTWRFPAWPPAWSPPRAPRPSRTPGFVGAWAAGW